MEITAIGVDLAKHVFQVHAVDAQGHTVLPKRLARSQMVQIRTSPAHSIKARGMLHQRAEYKDATDLNARTHTLLGNGWCPYKGRLNSRP